MPVVASPPSIIFINADLTQSVIDTFTRQLFLTSVIDGSTFNANVAADGYYVYDIHQLGQRVLVIRPANDQTNIGLADLVLFAKAGLVSVEYNNTGIPSITLPIDKVYLSALFNLNRPPPWDPRCRRWTGQMYHFDGEIINTDFNPIVPSPFTNPKYPGNRDKTGE